MIRMVLLGWTVAFFTLLGPAGCGKSSSSDSSTSGASTTSNLTGASKDAADAVMAEIKNHWVTGADGWITARTSGSAYAPDHFIRELREITVVDVQPDDVSDADKLNGIDWSGSVTFKQSPCREAGDPGMALEGLSTPTVDRQKGQWCQWVDWQPDPVRIQRTKGQWQIDQDTWLLRGTIPTDQDYANAGVK
jgi:hypothetical protein